MNFDCIVIVCPVCKKAHSNSNGCEPLSPHTTLSEVMEKIRERSLFNDSSIIEIDDAVLEDILSHYFR